MNFLNALLLSFVCISSVFCRGLREEFSWTRINYAWPGESRSYFSKGGGGDAIAFPGSTVRTRPVKPSSTPRPDNPDIPYIYQNNIPMGANVWKDKLFITIPRRRLGVPSSLNYVPVNSTLRHNLPLIPYPDWETNTLNQGSGVKFVSVYRVAIDPCDRLWFVDTGLIETLGNPTQVQPMALVIMDLKTDKIIRRHVFNSTVLKPATSLASLTIDVTKKECSDAFAYMPDLAGYGLVVYSFKDDSSWRVNHNYFAFEPLAGDFSIGGHQFQWNDGIFSIALSDIKPDGYRDAYFHSMAGVNQYKVSTRILKNHDLSTRSYHDSDFKFLGSRGDLSQTSSSDMDKSKGVLFLGMVNQNALGCWNIKRPLRDISIVQKDDEKMIYPSDVKISEDNLIVLTNTMPVFLYGNLNYDQTNFRVWVESVDMAIKGTKCEKSGGGGGRY